jgi:branched-chain amino acid transport system substrate-binding protein
LVIASCNRLGGNAEPHVIAHLAPRSGSEQTSGLLAAEAAALAVTEANTDAANHIGKRPVAVVHADTASEAASVSSQATRMLAVNQAQALIAGRDSEEFDRLNAAASTLPVVIIAPCGGGSTAPEKHIFPVGLAAPERGRCLAKYLAEERKIRSVALVVDSTATIHSQAAAAFESEFQHADRTIRTGYSVRSSQDLEAIAKRLTDAKAEAIVYCGNVGDLVTLASKIRSGMNDMSATLTAFAGENDGVIRRADPAVSAGIIYATPFVADDSAAAVQSFVAKFRSRTGKAPDSEAALTFDAVSLLLARAKKADTFKSDRLASDIDQMGEIVCLTGPFWFAKGRQPRRTVYIVEVRDGKSVLKKSYAPEKK